MLIAISTFCADFRTEWSILEEARIHFRTFLSTRGIFSARTSLRPSIFLCLRRSADRIIYERWDTIPVPSIFPTSSGRITNRGHANARFLFAPTPRNALHAAVGWRKRENASEIGDGGRQRGWHARSIRGTLSQSDAFQV